MVKFIHLDECHSTQDVVKEQLSIDDSQTYIVSCENQTNGHGRNQKVWNDSTGTVCFSFNLAPHIITSFSALEISVLVRKFFLKKNQEVKLKWPNDVLTPSGKKCAGILIQNSKDQYVAGIGLNLHLESEQFGGVFPQSFEVNKKLWSQEIATFILSNRYADTKLLIQEWNEGCLHLNKEVTITENEEVLKGEFIGLGEYGEALIQTNQGLKKVFNGTLRF